MSSDILCKFLAAGADKPSPQNDNIVAVAFTSAEKDYIADITERYGLASRIYAEHDGERIDVYMNRMEQQYNLPTVCLTKQPAPNGQPDYRFIAAGNYACVIPSNRFGAMQTMLSRILMTHFQKPRLRSFET